MAGRNRRHSSRARPWPCPFARWPSRTCQSSDWWRRCRRSRSARCAGSWHGLRHCRVASFDHRHAHVERGIAGISTVATSRRSRTPHIGAPAMPAAWLLPFAVLEHLLDLLLHRIEIEGCRILHRRIVDCRLRQLCDVLLDHNEAPELAREEVVAVAPGAGVGRLAPHAGRAFERVLANVDQAGHVRGDLFARPAPRLRKERELEVVEANRAQLRAAEIEQLAALGWAFAGEKIHLVVAIEMVLVGAVAELHALQQLIGDVRVAGRGHQGGQPIEAGEDAILDRARLDLARPADDRRHAEATLADGALGVLEWRHAAIRPSNTSAPLSVVKMTMVLLVSPMSSRCFSRAPT